MLQLLMMLLVVVLYSLDNAGVVDDVVGGGGLLSGCILVGSEWSNLLYSEPGGQSPLSFDDHVLELVDGRPVLAGLLHGQVRLDLVVVVGQLMDDRPGGVEVSVGGLGLRILLNLTLHLQSIVDPVANRSLGIQILVV